MDTVRIFAEHSPAGLTGAGLFADGQHPNMAGYLLLAGGCARELSAALREPVRRNYKGPDDAFAAFSYGKEKQAAALVASGRWLFSAAAKQARPGLRLNLTRGCFQKAAALDPNNFSPWLGLGLAEAAARTDLISKESGLDWLAKYGLYYGSRYKVTYGQLLVILKELASRGVPARITDRILAEAAGDSAFGAGSPAALDPLADWKIPAAAPTPADTARAKSLSDSAVEKMRNGDLRGAGELLRSALAHDGSNPEALMNACSLLGHENKKEQALEACRRVYYAVNSNRQESPLGFEFLPSDASYEKYRLLASMGRPGEAAKVLENCVRTAPARWPGLPAARTELAGIRAGSKKQGWPAVKPRC